MRISVVKQAWQLACIKEVDEKDCIALNIPGSLKNVVTGDMAGFQVALCTDNQYFLVCFRCTKEARHS